MPKNPDAMTQFEKAVKARDDQQMGTPVVIVSNNQIDYFAYQLATHLFHLKLMSKNMRSRMFRLKDFKEYYGLTGRSAKDCVPQLEEIKDKYMNKLKSK